MMINSKFEIVGLQDTSIQAASLESKRKRYRLPNLSLVVLLLLVAACMFYRLIITKDPTYMDLEHNNIRPNSSFYFGTDTMGRDIFSMIWYGGRVSLFIGICSTMLSTLLAILIGAISGCANARLDALIMRFTEIFLSIPNLLIILLLQAMLGKPNVLSISFVIGFTSWSSIAKVVRTEVKQIRTSEYVIASKCMGGSFYHILKKHLAPNFASSIMFMVIMNVKSAIVAESTLSFMGIGLPLEIISWGSMLSLSDQALMTKSWWIILIPGFFLTVTLLCLTRFCERFRNDMNQKPNNL